MAVAHTTSAADWSIAYAVTIRRLDNQFMLCLLRLESWPNIDAMHGDLVDTMKLICAMLEKRPMVGFLVARRLKLPVDKTYALLSVLKTKGHVATVGADVEQAHLEVVKDSAINDQSTLSQQPTAQRTLSNESSIEPDNAALNAPAENSGDVLNQLWRVLNTDISWSKAANETSDPKAASIKDAGDVLGQLWRVLNTDIAIKTDTNNQPIAPTEAEITAYQAQIDESASVMRQLWSVLNTDIAFKRQTGSVEKDSGTDEKTKEVSDVLSQLWRVLNTEIANKRQSNTIGATVSATDTTVEANDKLSQLWRILDTEITLKKKSKTYVMKASKGHPDQLPVNDTSSEAVSRLSQLWEVLNSEIAVTMPPEHRLTAVNSR
jgi:hypothetical protein